MEVSSIIVLKVLGIILLALGALSLLRIKFDIYASEEICVKLNILGIKFCLYPKKEKKVKVKKFKKGYPKEKKEKAPKETKTSRKENKDTEEKIPLGEKISTIISLIKLLLGRFFKHLRLDVSKITVVVGGSDAANAAISYGIISQAVAYLLAFLDNNLNISKKRGGEIKVLCDFTSESITYDIFISASVTVWQILDILISLAYNYLKGKDIFNIKKMLIGGQKNNGGKQD